MAWVIGIIAIIAIILIIGKIIDYRDNKKLEKDFAKDTAIARLNMHNHKFISQEPPSDGWGLVKLHDFRYAYINEYGEYLGNLLFIRAETFNNGVAQAFIVNQGDCLIKKDGTFALAPLQAPKKDRHIKFLFDKYYLVSDCIHLSRGTVRYEYYIINRDGILITKKPFDKYLEFTDGIFKVKTGKLISEYDEEGNLLNPPFSEKIDIGEGLYKVMESKYQWGIYDSNTKEMIIPCLYSDIFFIPEFNTSEP